MSEYQFIFPNVTFTPNSAIVPDSIKCAIAYGILIEGQRHGKESLDDGLLLISQINHQYVITGTVLFGIERYEVEVRLYRANGHHRDLAHHYETMPEGCTIPKVGTEQGGLGGMPHLFKGLDHEEYYSVGSVVRFVLISS